MSPYNTIPGKQDRVTMRMAQNPFVFAHAASMNRRGANAHLPINQFSNNQNNLRLSAMKKYPRLVSALGLCAAILLPNVAKAAFVTLDDASPAETITISWGGFLSGVIVNNAPQPTNGSVTINENVANTIDFQ